MPPNHLFAGVFSPRHERAWRHLDVVYRMFHRLHLLFPHHNVFNSDFLRQLFELFATPDSDERQELVQFFKSYIPKHPADHQLIQTSLCDLIRIHTETHEKPLQVIAALPILLVLFEFTESGYGIIESAIVPLLRDRYLEFFHLDLANILEFFTSNKPDNVRAVVREILNHWPRLRVQKICILTIILIDYLPRLSDDDQRVFLPIALRIFAEDCNSPAPKVAETTLAFFLASEFDTLMVSHAKTMLDTLVPSVLLAAQRNWEPAIRERAMLGLAIMSKMEPNHFKKVSSEWLAGKKESGTESRRTQWQIIIQACAGSVDGAERAMDDMETLFQDDVQPSDDEYDDTSDGSI
jgi:hypothetical protein